MASPQKEHGHLKIANELWGALAQADLTSTEYKIILTVIRKTYGFNKKEDRISISQFSEYTRISKSMICRAVNKLVNRSILVKQGSLLKGETNSFRLNKDYSQWVVKQGILVNQIDLGSEPAVNRGSEPSGTYKRQYTKDKQKGNFCNFCKTFIKEKTDHQEWCQMYP